MIALRTVPCALVFRLPRSNPSFRRATARHRRPKRRRCLHGQTAMASLRLRLRVARRACVSGLSRPDQPRVRLRTLR